MSAIKERMGIVAGTVALFSIIGIGIVGTVMVWECVRLLGEAYRP